MLIIQIKVLCVVALIIEYNINKFIIIEETLQYFIHCIKIENCFDT